MWLCEGGFEGYLRVVQRGLQDERVGEVYSHGGRKERMRFILVSENDGEECFWH